MVAEAAGMACGQDLDQFLSQSPSVFPSTNTYSSALVSTYGTSTASSGVSRGGADRRDGGHICAEAQGHSGGLFDRATRIDRADGGAGSGGWGMFS